MITMSSTNIEDEEDQDDSPLDVGEDGNIDSIVREAKSMYKGLMARYREFGVSRFKSAYNLMYEKKIEERRIELLQLDESIDKLRKETEEILSIPAGNIKVTVRCQNILLWPLARFVPSAILSDIELYYGIEDCVSSIATNQQPVKSKTERRVVRSDDEEVYSHWRKSDILIDSDDQVRGVRILLQGSDEQRVLKLLYDIYEHFEKNMGQVQTYSKHLLHYNCSNPGFPVVKGTIPVYVQEMEKYLSSRIRQELVRIGYCVENQELQLYLSFMKTLKTEVQAPHIDFHWEDISPGNFKKRPRAYKDNYKEWVPFIALFPLTQDGMTIEVWNSRSKHSLPECNEGLYGVLVNIAFGEILVLRADVVHAGGFATAASGNPRGHFYIYKTPRGVQHSYPLSNCYDVEVNGNNVPLSTFYKHCAGP